MCVNAGDTEHRKHQGEKRGMQRGETAVASNGRTSTSSWCRWGREWTHTRGPRLRDGGHQGEKNVSVRGGPSARASRQERSALLAQQAGAVNEVAKSVSGLLERRDGGVGQGCVVPVKADLSVKRKGGRRELFEAG
ncbi:unnamed protein product [Ectocarpus sp. 8 AP-2014]